jgi:hypothetical protein
MHQTAYPLAEFVKPYALKIPKSSLSNLQSLLPNCQPSHSFFFDTRIEYPQGLPGTFFSLQLSAI